MGKISGLNHAISCFHIYHAQGPKSNKMVITREE
jgi:hypothetical protein